MATNHAVCSICDQQSISTESEVWCVECEESFCGNHAENHKLMKATKHHITIPIENQLKIADATSDVLQYCQKHNSKLVQFCLTHDQPICSECIGDHAKCGDVISLSKLFEQAKSSDTLTGVTETVEDYIANIQKMTKDRKERKLILQQEKIRCLSEMTEFRDRINTHLDTLETRFRTKIDRLTQKAIDEIQETEIELKDKETCLRTEKNAINDIQTHASEIQKFFYARKVQEKVAEAGREITDIIEKKLEITNLKYSFSQDLQDMMSKVTEFGCIELKREQCKVSLALRENKKAQFNMPQKYKDINCLKLERIREFDAYQQTGTIRGCCFVGNEDVIFTNHPLSHLVRFLNGSKTTISIENGAFDVTHIHTRWIAISSGDCKKKQNGITVFDLGTNTPERFIELPYPTFGVSFYDNCIYCCVAEKGIFKVSVTNWTISCFLSINLASYSYIFVDSNMLYFTSKIANAVYCYNINGDKLWEYMNSYLLCGSFIGVTADRSGTVFVSSEERNTILVISVDGKRMKVVLAKKDDLQKPTGLHYNQSNNEILVACCDEKAKLYRIIS